MKVGNIVSAVFSAILKVIFTVAVIYVIYRGGSFCYDYGYRIFTEPAVSSGEGRVITVSVTEEMSPTEIGEIFESKGLVKDGRLFALQYLLSEYRSDVKPGVFELSTAMTAEEMMEVMASEETDTAGTVGGVSGGTGNEAGDDEEGMDETEDGMLGNADDSQNAGE